MIGTSAEKQLIGDVCHFRCWLINCKTVVDSILVEDVFLETVWSSPVCVLFLHLINLLPSKITLLKRRNFIKLVNCEFTLFHSHNKLTRGVKWESYFKLFCQIWKKKTCNHVHFPATTYPFNFTRKKKPSEIFSCEFYDTFQRTVLQNFCVRLLLRRFNLLNSCNLCMITRRLAQPPLKETHTSCISKNNFCLHLKMIDSNFSHNHMSRASKHHSHKFRYFKV